MAHRADHIFLMARTDPDAPKHRGISFLLCDMDDPGVTVNPIINMADSHHFNMVTFDNVRIPKKNLVGELNRGWYVGATILDFVRLRDQFPQLIQNPTTKVVTPITLQDIFQPPFVLK